MHEKGCALWSRPVFQAAQGFLGHGHPGELERAGACECPPDPWHGGQAPQADLPWAEPHGAAFGGVGAAGGQGERGQRGRVALPAEPRAVHGVHSVESCAEGHGL